MNSYESLRQKDLSHLWHPFTRINSFESGNFPIITKAGGVYLYDTKGKSYLDGISSWWCVNLGHNHPELVKAVKKQVEILDQSILGGMSHENALLLAEKLAEISPGKLGRVLFASDGASAVEAALKISLQYWANIGKPERNMFVSLRDAYHGDTLGAVGVGYIESFHKSYKHVLKQSLRADSPHCFHCPFGKEATSCSVECFFSMERIIEENKENIAAVIVEPVCQGAAGMRIYPAEYLKKLRALCSKFDILLIADEIAVGFGRTGRLFACEYAGIEPDIMCLGKALTGGMLPLSATICTNRIYNAFRDTNHADRTFYHGHTTCGSPITTAAALAALHVYKKDKIIKNSGPVMKILGQGFRSFQQFPHVYKTNSLGMMSSLEIRTDKVAANHPETKGIPVAGNHPGTKGISAGAELAAKIAAKALNLGLFIRPLGNILYLWPPLTTTKDQMEEMISLMGQALKAE